MFASYLEWMVLNSAIYQGLVRHRRFTPVYHEFNYLMFMLKLDLDELNQINEQRSWFKINRFAPLQFKTTDYLGGDHDIDQLKPAVIDRAKQLGANKTINKVYFVGNVRCWGLYFSPVNFFYLYDGDKPVYLLAEVSNTPWNETHCYLLDWQQKSCVKTFHVSPFNNLDMVYQWRFTEPKQKLMLHIENHKDGKLFDATMQFKKAELNKTNLKKLVIAFPSMTVKILSAIYWQALKLMIKGVPFIGYVASSTDSTVKTSEK